MSDIIPGGGIEVKASVLVKGDTIRDPRKPSRILVVEDVGSVVFVRGYEKDDMKYHRFIGKDTYVTKVTNAGTETTVDPV